MSAISLVHGALASGPSTSKKQKDSGQAESLFLLSPEKGKLAACWVVGLGSRELGSEPGSGLLVKASPHGYSGFLRAGDDLSHFLG